MKYLVAGSVFILALGLSVFSFASENETSCKPESKNCAPAVESKHEGQHEDLAAKMNSLFPGKVKNPALATVPGAVELVEPKFLTSVAAGNVKLTWTDSKAPEYHLQVATDPNFKWLVVNEKFVKGTSYEVKTEAGKKYFWRVAGFNSGNDSYFTKSAFTSSAFSTK